MASRQTTLLVEQIMAELKKSNCTSVKKIITETGLSRNTLNSYMNALGIAKIKFPFDSKVYISNDDYTRLRAFIAENKKEEE